MPENHYIDHQAGCEARNFCPGLPLRHSSELEVQEMYSGWSITQDDQTCKNSLGYKFWWVFTGGVEGEDQL